MTKINKYDLSICLPGYRIANWERLYNSVYDSCKRYSWEMVLTGPQQIEEVSSELLSQTNFRYISDKGSPARCGQIATTYAQGEYLTWSSDDGYFLEDSLDLAIDLIKSKTYKDIVAMRYLEGPNFSGKLENPEWFIGVYHADQRLPGVNPNWKIAPVGMYNTEYFRWLGGWDCTYEHLNMSCHSLAYRAQKNGSEIYLSEGPISNHHWDVNHETWQPMRSAYQLNDLPLFQKEFAVQNNIIQIPYDNWKNSPEVWGRRKI